MGLGRKYLSVRSYALSKSGVGRSSAMIRISAREERRVHREFSQVSDIVIPTGRNGFCCIIPCALLCGLYAATGVGALALIRRWLRKRA